MSATAVILLIRVLAPLYGVDPDLALVICRRESAFDPRAIGDGGAAHGLWQWHIDSWEHVRYRMGRSLDDRRFDALESTETALYAMGVLHLYRWWSTFEPALQELERFRGQSGPSDRPVSVPDSDLGA